MRKVNQRIIALALCISFIFAVSACGNENAGTQTAKKETTIQDPTVVKTQFGRIRGSLADQVVAFKGVPYAKPPLHKLRFKAPRTLDNWKGTKSCTSFAPSAVQNGSLGHIKQSEDCLYLNVWTPETAKEKKDLPVYVWIHGGAFAKGSPSKSLYQGSNFAKSGIIQVNVTYRLNALGFIGEKSLNKENGAQGNLGILDQIAALKWIQDNIEEFGGDPNNVTIGGESAGSFSVSNLMMSPKAKGLFHRAILESGNLLGQPVAIPFASGEKKQAAKLADRFMQYMGADSINQLRKIDARILADASNFNGDITNPAPFGFWPVFDGRLLPENPYRALMSGQMNGVDIMAGFNTDEGSIFVPDGTTEQTYEDLVRMIFKKNAPRVMKRFPIDAKHSATDRMRQLFTIALRMGSEVFARELTEQGYNAYYYNFDYHTKEADEKGLGVPHALELPFVFGTLNNRFPGDKTARALSKEMHDYWGNFIKNGSPNGKSLRAKWPKYRDSNGQMMVFGDKIKQEPIPDTDDIEFITRLIWDNWR